jgi:glycosyltransferase involved in cell wall biosynthesis
VKIGIFTDSYKPYTSGVVTSITTFKKELEKLGHQLFIFAPNYSNYVETEEGVYRYYSVPAPTNPDFTLAIPVFPGMKYLLRKLDLDIIHVHSPFTMGRVGLHYARRLNLPIVFTYHTLYDQYIHYLPVAQELAREMTVKFSNNFCRQVDHLIVPSSEVSNILSSYDISTPISVIPTGVPVQLFKAVSRRENILRERYDIPAENKILLNVGRLTKEKNLEFLLDAFARVHRQKPQTTLVITAQGPLESALKQQVAELGLSLERDVIFTGAVPFETLIQVYYSADLFIFSSMTETQGLVLVEAMAAGLPVVAIKAYGVLDMVDHGINGLLTACDQEEFTRAVLRMLNDDKVYQFFRHNALLKAEEISSQNMTLELEKVYQQLINKNVHRRSRVYDWLSRIAP